ncbi:MAG: CPBP family intramembrane metalloprotease [Oscillospiraceae bacterium]|nr:CPBP family intramembrane metalloprotease [Oscillospiraceae bacterium]
MQTNPSPLPDLKPERRYCSVVGFSLLIYSLICLLLQTLGQTLLTQFAPHLANVPLVFFAVLLLPSYIIGTPVCALGMRFAPSEKIEKKKIKPSHFFIAALMCFTFMYSGNLIGTLVGTLADQLCGSQSGIAELLTNSSTLANIIFVVILAPIVEELIFRKFIVDRMVRYGELTAVLCSGLLFGLFHGNFYQFFYAALLGMFFAFIYVKTGRIRITMLLHAVVNFFGGVVGPIVLELLGSDYESIMSEALEILSAPGAGFAAIEEAADLLLPLVPGLLALSVYEVFFMGCVIAGFVLLIVFRRRITFAKGKVDLDGNAFSVTWLNVGTLLFSVMCAVLFALNLTA